MTGRVARGKSSPAPTKPKTQDIGDQVITLRSEGQSFASIAKTVGLKRSLEAFGVFVDALASRPASEQKRLRKEENGRLDTLEQGMRRRADSPELDRKLAAIVQLRRRLAAS